MEAQSKDEKHDDERNGSAASEAPDSTEAPASRGSGLADSTARGTVTLRIRRQDGQNPRVEWDSYAIPRLPGMTVLGALKAIQRSPIAVDGRDKAPPAFEAGCFRGVCGACTMIINGRVRLACRTSVDEVSPKGKPIQLEALTKFPLVRDLIVDRGQAERALREVNAWVQLETAPSSRPREAPVQQRRLEALGRCIGCAACLEACPQYGEHSDYLGPAALAQVARLNETQAGQWQRDDRLALVMAPGGIADCGKAQNCVEVCPVEVPVVDGLQQLARATTREMLLGWLLGH